MSTCTFVCQRVRVRASEHVHAFVIVRVRSMRARVHACARLRLYPPVCMYASVRAHMCAHARTYAWTYVCTCADARALCACVCACLHVCRHMHWIHGSYGLVLIGVGYGGVLLALVNSSNFVLSITIVVTASSCKLGLSLYVVSCKFYCVL